MTPTCEMWLFATAAVIQMLGMATVVVARLSERWPTHRYCYPLCYLGLLAVGGMTLLAVAVGHGIWLSCGLTLALMAVGATLDVGSRRTAPAC